MVIGVISDTHGTVSQQALDALNGAASILHAGDIGDPDVIQMLSRIAPVTAVRGNTDSRRWAYAFPLTEMISLAERCFYVLHDVTALDIDPPSAGINIVVHGHTHQAQIETIKDTLYFNPGSASVRRHGGPLTIGRINISNGRIRPAIIQIGR